VPIEVAARLHADYCITGTVRRSGKVFRSTVHLTDACIGTVIWAHEFALSASGLDVSVLDPEIQRIVATIGDIFGVLARAVWMRASQKSGHQLSAYEAVVTNSQYQSDILGAAALSQAGELEKARVAVQTARVLR
jgi:hypothetical protein